MKYICVRKCFYNGNLFREGEIVEFTEKPSRHFKPYKHPLVSEENSNTDTELIESMKKQLEEKGVVVDKRWGVTRLQQEIAKLAVNK